MIEETICDLCGEFSFIKVYQGNIDPADDPLNYYSSSRQNASHWPIVKCSKCGLHRSNPRDNSETLKCVYEKLADEIYDEEEDNRVFIAQKRIKEINRLSSAGKILDIGCSSGIFAQQAAKTTWKVTGLDPSHWAIMQAKKRCSTGTFLVSTIEDADFQSSEFDLITLWDVLEHVASPTETLQKINFWLVEDGLLVMNIPNISSYTAKLMKENWVLLLREHLWFFDPNTITKLLHKTGFEVISIKPNRVRFSLKNIFIRISQYPALKFIHSLSKLSGINKITLNLSIGEMEVYSRKIR